MAGAPKGNKNATRGKFMKSAMLKAIKIESGVKVVEGGKEDFQALVDISLAQIKKAKEGDIQAYNAIADRLDGKPGQSIDMIADVTSRNITELSDAELEDIATRGS